MAHKIIQSGHIDWDKLDASSFIQLLAKIKLEYYDTYSKTNPILQIPSTPPSFFVSNKSNKNIADNNNYHIPIDIPL